MEKLQRVFKPIFEEMLQRGLIERRAHKVSGAIKLDLLLDALDARFMSYGGAYAEDLAEMILQGMNVETESPEVLKAFLIGFNGGQTATESGAARMNLADGLAGFSAVGRREDEE